MASDTSGPASLGADITPSSLDFPVVGIGASAGGLDPLTRFFEAMPVDSGMAFVVVVHLSPTHASGLPGLLQAATSIPVIAPEGPQPIEANHIYVISPDKLLSMNDGYLRVTAMEPTQGRQVAIDLFFRSLATVHRERAVAVVLSGAGADGAVGLARIKEEGGLTLVQRPSDAEFDSMPRAAIATGAIDWVLPVSRMPDRLVEMWANAKSIELPHAPEEGIKVPAPATPEAAKDAEEALREILAMLRARTGHDFRNYKRATVLRRLERRLQVHGLRNLPAYRALLQGEPEEAQALLRDMLIGATNFFRDPEAFDALQNEALRPIVERSNGSFEGLRIWVPGCATGEEAYSIAMLLAEEAARVNDPASINIFATDIDDAAISVARLASYPAGIQTDVTPGRLRRFFDRDAQQHRIRKELREKVMFASHNILRDPPFSKLDLISCRNLLIYLDREVHAEVLQMFHFALRPGGLLFLGNSETADTAGPLFSVVDKKHRIYRANVVARTARYVPALVAAAPAPAGPPLAPAAEPVRPRRVPTYAGLHQRLAEEHAPPSVLIDAEANIVHLSDKAGRFLRHAGGEPSHQLLSLVGPELRLELRTAVFQALRSGRSVEARRVKIEQDGRALYVKMIVRPVIEPQLEQQLVLVLFDDVEDSVSRGEEDGGRDPVVVHLEEELRRTKEQLQGTIEQSETSTEELKASNEELQAINEELRSTTEELETSKEELQSINEELITVNNELKAKVEETGKINDDLQNLISSTDIATVFVDRAMSIKRFTPRAMRLFNLIATDVGRSLLDITHRLDYPELADDAGEAFQSLRVIEREVASDDRRWYLARLLPYRTTEDRIDGAVLTFVDITTRRQAEDNMRLVAECTKDHAIVTTDLTGRVTTWNTGAERIFGYAQAEMLGQPADVLFVEEDRAAGVPEEEMRRARDEGRAEDDRWHLRKDGTRFFCSGIMTPLHEGGELRGYAKIARDLTGSKRAEQQREGRLRQHAAERAAAEAANQLKDEFLAVMSHELKNPLNLIQLNAELLSRLPEARSLPSVARATDIIRKTVLSQAQIIDDMLDLSRINTGKLKLERGPVDLAATARMIVEALKDEAPAKQVELALLGGEAQIVVYADRTRIEQIIWNLLSNAIKFTPAQGRVAVRLSCEGGFARVDVEDTGRGLAPEFLPKAFDMFTQEQGGSARRHGSGLGIGLALVRSLAEMHGGRVEVHSDGIDRGARFSVWLPLRHSERGTEREAAQSQPWLAGRRVLVVDDDRQGVDTLRQLLEMEGADVVAVFDVPAALAAASGGDTAFDVVITDIAMPDMDGYQLLDALRAEEATLRIPVIALTGFGRPSDVKRAIAAGFDAHLRKPATLGRLLRALEQVLGKQL